MADVNVDNGRLSEVSRLAGVLADQVLRESMMGDASMMKLTALGKAALLLQDYDQPVPDLVVDVLTRVMRTGEDDGDAEAEVGSAEAADAQPDTEDSQPRRRLLPRLMQSLRPLRT